MVQATKEIARLSQDMVNKQFSEKKKKNVKNKLFYHWLENRLPNLVRTMSVSWVNLVLPLPICTRNWRPIPKVLWLKLRALKLLCALNRLSTILVGPVSIWLKLVVLDRVPLTTSLPSGIFPMLHV